MYTPKKLHAYMAVNATVIEAVAAPTRYLTTLALLFKRVTASKTKAVC